MYLLRISALSSSVTGGSSLDEPCAVMTLEGRAETPRHMMKQCGGFPHNRRLGYDAPVVDQHFADQGGSRLVGRMGREFEPLNRLPDIPVGAHWQSPWLQPDAGAHAASAAGRRQEAVLFTSHRAKQP